MRHSYLTRACNVYGGCRGGVSDGCDEYELEIGQDQKASPEMMALCVYIDEVMEFLEVCNSPVGLMILQGIKAEAKRLDASSSVVNASLRNFDATHTSYKG